MYLSCWLPLSFFLSHAVAKLLQVIYPRKSPFRRGTRHHDHHNVLLGKLFLVERKAYGFSFSGDAVVALVVMDYRDKGRTSM